MAKTIKLKAAPRTGNGSAAARRLRRDGVLPAAVKRLSGTCEAISIDAHEYELAMRGQASNPLVTLDIDGTEVSALLREVQNNVITSVPIHADFGEVSLTEKIRTAVDITLVGEPVGVTAGGGIMDQVLRHIEVECLPTDIIASLDVDVSSLHLGELLTVGDLKLGSAYTVLTDKSAPVVTIVAPAAEDEKETDEEGAEDGEPEVIAKGKDEATA